MSHTKRNTPYRKIRNLVAKNSSGKGGPMLSEHRKPLRGKAAVQDAVDEMYREEDEAREEFKRVMAGY